MITFDIFRQIEGLIHAFSIREAEGGRSKGPFYNLNMGNYQYDQRQHIEHNRALFFKQNRIDPHTIVSAQQIHSANVRLVDQPGVYPGSDALVTRQKNIFLSILTADCFPVFLVEPESMTIALIHAGWRGVVNQIITKTIKLMSDQLAVDAKKLLAAIGPGLKTECFEVRADVYRLFPEKFQYPHPDRTKKYIDLGGCIGENLLNAGLAAENIEISGLCSQCRQDLFFSFRRDGEKSGRMMGILGICN